MCSGTGGGTRQNSSRRSASTFATTKLTRTTTKLITKPSPSSSAIADCPTAAAAPARCIGRSKQWSAPRAAAAPPWRDRKSTRLNSSHVEISYAVFCLKKKTTNTSLLKKEKKKKQ